MGIRKHSIPEGQRVSQNPSCIGVYVIPIDRTTIVISSVGLLWTSNFIDSAIFLKLSRLHPFVAVIFIYQSDIYFLDEPLMPAVALFHGQLCLPFAVVFIANT